MNLKSSIFYKLNSKKRLRRILGLSEPSNNLFFKQIENGNLSQFYKPVKKSKKNGNGYRIINAPTAELKKVQKKIWKQFKKISRPDWVFGGEPGKSVITHADYHKDAIELFKLDISDFFPHVSRERVFDFFYTEMKMAKNLAGIMSNINVLGNELPQGGAMSTVLSFYANRYMFEKLFFAAEKHNLKMSLYIDDVYFSSSSPISTVLYSEIRQELIGIIQSQGYPINGKKVIRYTSTNLKKITGLYITQQGSKSISYKNQLEISKMFQTVKRIIENDKSAIMRPKSYERRLYLRLMGNLNYVDQVMGDSNQFTYMKNWLQKNTK